MKEREKILKQKAMLLLRIYENFSDENVEIWLYENFSDKNVEKFLTKKITQNGEKYIIEISEY